MADDLTGQLNLQNSINDAIKERSKIIDEQNKLVSKQSAMYTAMIKSMQAAKGAGAQQASMTTSVKDSSNAVDDATKKQSAFSDALKKTADQSKKTGMSIKNFLLSPFRLLGKLFGGVVKVGSSMVSGLIDMAASIGKLALTIVSFPFKVFQGLINLAQQFQPNPALLEAMEEVREAFGDLARGPAKDVIDGFNGMRKSSSNLAETGLSLRKIYGWGINGLAAALRDLNEMAKAAGDSFSRLGKTFSDSGVYLIAFQKGLGITAENMMKMSDVMVSRGQDVKESMMEFSEISIKTALSFGLGVKDMARGMTDLAVDVQNFGHLGPKAFAPIVVYARKLGLEIKDLSGTMSKFSGFVETTEAASKMSQTFGMNVDAMKLMAAQNPAEKIDILRESFFATGQEMKDMNYQQRQYLTSLTGLEGKSLEAAFATSQQGISYEKIAKQADKANKKQMDQKEVMIELGKQIKRLVQVMSLPKVSGFFDAFVKGFETGIQRSGPFRKMIRNINKDLRLMWSFGIKVGKMFVEYFPGVKDMIKSISEFFEPRRFKAFSNTVLPLFKELFQTQNFSRFFSGLKAAFSENFGDASGKGGIFLSGFRKFFEAMTKLAGEALGRITELFLSGLTKIGQMILHPEETIAAIKSGLSGTGSATSAGFANLLNPSIAALTGPKGKELVDTFKEIYEKAKNAAWESITGLWDKIIAKWNDPKFKSDLFNKVASTLWESLKFAAKYAWEHPGYAALLALVFNPFGARSLVLSLGGTILKTLGSAFSFALRALPSVISGLGSVFSGIGSAISGGVSAGLGGATGLLTAGLGAAFAVAGASIFASLTAGKIMDNDRSKDGWHKIGYTKGEAWSNQFVKGLTLGFVDPIGDAAEASKKRLEQFEVEFQAMAEKSAKSINNIFSKDFNDEVGKIIKSGGKFEVPAAGEGGTIRMLGVSEEQVQFLYRKQAQKMLTEAFAKGDEGLAALVGKDNVQRLRDTLSANNGAYTDGVINLLEGYGAKNSITESMHREIFEAQKNILGEKEKKQLADLVTAKGKAEFLQTMYETVQKIKDLQEKTKGINTSQLVGIIDEMRETSTNVYDFMNEFSGMMSAIVTRGLDLSSMNSASETFTNFNDAFERLGPSISGIVSTSTDLSKIKNVSFKKVSDNIESSLSMIDDFVLKLQNNNVLNAMTNISAIRNATYNFEEVADALVALKHVTERASALKSKDISAIVNIAKSVATVAESLSNANEMLSPDKVENVIPVLESLKNFKGGKIEMTHNMPNAVIKLNVNINSKKLGQSIVTTDLSNDTKKQLYPQLGNVDNKDLLKPA